MLAASSRVLVMDTAKSDVDGAHSVVILHSGHGGLGLTNNGALIDTVARKHILQTTFLKR